MCFTNCSLPGAHHFNFLQIRHFWKTQTSGSHQNFMLSTSFVHPRPEMWRLEMCSTISNNQSLTIPFTPCLTPQPRPKQTNEQRMSKTHNCG